MDFNQLSSLFEEHKLGRKKPLPLKLQQLENHELRHASTLLFGEDIDVWSYEKMVSHIAKETGVYSEIVKDIASNKQQLIVNLCSESVGKGKGLTLTEAANTLRAFSKDNEMSFIDCARIMNQIEASLFWSMLLGSRKPITKQTFLMSTLRNGITKEIVLEKNYRGNDFELNKVINVMIHTPHLMSTESHTIYRKRGLKRWSDRVILTDYNGGYTQLIDGKGNRILSTIDECIIEHTNEDIVYDVFFTNDKELNLIDRLKKFDEEKNKDFVVCYPVMIPSWKNVEEWAENNTVRFPDMKPYKNDALGGYVLVLNDLIRSLRVCHYHTDEIKLFIGMEMLDGTDFMLCGELEITDIDEMGYFYRTMKKYNVENQHDEKVIVNSDKCIVMDIVSPSFDLDNRIFRHPVFLTFDSDKGIREVTQLVDVMV
tara:strand:- start:8351 stop:9631 length:1281 start_codon:yes stop_codon:yes gene_type:complete